MRRSVLTAAAVSLLVLTGCGASVPEPPAVYVDPSASAAFEAALEATATPTPSQTAEVAPDLLADFTTSQNWSGAIEGIFAPLRFNAVTGSAQPGQVQLISPTNASLSVRNKSDRPGNFQVEGRIFAVYDATSPVCALDEEVNPVLNVGDARCLLTLGAYSQLVQSVPAGSVAPIAFTATSFPADALTDVRVTLSGVEESQAEQIIAAAETPLGFATNARVVGDDQTPASLCSLPASLSTFQLTAISDSAVCS